MHIMLKKSAALSLALAALFVSPVSAAIVPSRGVEAKTFNLQGHEKRINAYHAKMTKEGKELSKEFMNVHQGMKKGNYKYDLATARKVMQEVHAKRMPAAPHGLK
ncbi:MAG: hypothetical protein LLF94_00085 [Chlamydiales bacterium]|nr:hypothetical protein [Chlamydiales bacterium]